MEDNHPAGAADPRSYSIIGAAMETHRELGHGFLEPVYHEALELELASREIPGQHEVELPIFFKGRRLTARYRADFVCYESIILELKAVSQLTTGKRPANHTAAEFTAGHGDCLRGCHFAAAGAGCQRWGRS